MKKRLVVSVMVVLFALLMVAPAIGADRRVELPITNKVTTLDRNGNEYTRLIVTESKTIQGISYNVGVPAMAFGSVNEGAKMLEIGDMLKAIVSDRSFNGRDSLTIRALIE